MAFELGNALDLEDLLAKLDTFATGLAAPWSTIYASNPQTTDGWFELNKGNLSFSAKFPVGAQGPPQHMSVHHATGSTSSAAAPGAHTADSGNGYTGGTTGHTNANLLTERCVSQIGNGPFPSYRFFSDVSPDYIHVVVETVTGTFRHFGFGGLERFGDNWVGSEYVYGSYIQQTTTTTPTAPQHDTLLDGLATVDARSATIRIASGLLNQSPAVWGVSSAQASASLDNDTAGNVRRQIHGSFRAGMEPRGFGNMIGNTSSGVIAMYSIAAYYRDPSNPRVQLLGHMPDVRACNIKNLVAGDEITVGTDTWIAFPMSIKSSAAVLGRTRNSGIAYRKV